MFECYKVLRPFKWRGWHYGPAGRHITQEKNPETGEPVECDCPFYAGHVWVVEEGHSRKESVLDNRKARADVTLLPDEFASYDAWIKSDPDLMKLTNPPASRMVTYTPPGQRQVRAAAGVQ
jgi:hypothetical protein